MSRKVVITGMGSVSPLGLNCEKLSASLQQGRSGIRAIKHFDTTNFSVKFAGQVKDFDSSNIKYDQKVVSRLDPFMHYSLAASIEAIESSNLEAFDELDKTKVGVILGSGIGGLTTIEHNTLTHDARGPRRIAPSFIPSTIINMPAGHLSIKYGFQGPNLSTVTACTTGTHCIAQAFDMIKLDYADVMIAGSGEKASTPLGIGGFASTKALSTRNDSPETACRPWDTTRDGFVLSDGAASVVLEEEQHALARGANILAEVVSVGYSADAFHMTTPHSEGLGAQLAINQALTRGNISYNEIDHINAHSTATVAGDLLELKAIQSVFKGHTKNIAITSTKSMTGHLLGAAGSLEAIISILALKEQFIPPTINVTTPDPLCDDFDINFSNKSSSREITTVLSNSFGFGGTNGCLILRKYS